MESEFRKRVNAFLKAYNELAEVFEIRKTIEDISDLSPEELDLKVKEIIEEFELHICNSCGAMMRLVHYKESDNGKVKTMCENCYDNIGIIVSEFSLTPNENNSINSQKWYQDHKIFRKLKLEILNLLGSADKTNENSRGALLKELERHRVFFEEKEIYEFCKENLEK